MVIGQTITEKQFIHCVILYTFVFSGKVEAGQMRYGEHSDFGSITLLYTDAPGLQVHVYEQTLCSENLTYQLGF